VKSSASAVFLVLVALGASSRAAAGQLGTVSFPTSATREAQPLIERGVALMHSFQYDEAAQAFDDAARRDSRCAMCHWGKAMVLYQQIWQRPSPQDLATGLREIRLAQRTGAKTPRERAYIAAAAAFFQGPAGTSHVSRIQAYSRRLASLHRDYPADADAAAFYALSFIALAGEDVEQLANLRGAIDVLEPYLRSQPDHPGVAHYLIHAADMPELAPRGLEAARKYATIAPDSSHALHMPSHIFVRLGLWQETIDLNLRAAAAGASAMYQHHGSPDYELHAVDYLTYAYLQSGQESKARQTTDISRVVGVDADVISNFGAHLTARNALDLHRWNQAAALVVPNRPRRVIETYCARAVGAARLGDVASARQDVIALRQAASAQQAQSRAAGNEVPSTPPTELEEGEAWLAFGEGRMEDAIAQLRRVAEQEDADGGESVTVPAREMLADLLLEISRPAEALETYKAALRHAPNRFNSLYGAARAAEALADDAEARSYFSRLIGVVPPGADRPEIGEAKAFVEAH
jgi:tetratricopeptide (TPR) repeat protein